MYLKRFHLVIFITTLLLLQDAAGFFVKHIQTGMCIIDTNIIPAKGGWGSISFVELANNSLDPAAQFRFRDSGAMLNLNRAGCLHAHNKYSGYHLDMFYFFANEKSLDGSACVHAITQTSWGGLSVYYKGRGKKSFENWCAIPKTYEPLALSHGIDPYIGLTTNCTDTEDKRFNFGSVTCHGNMIENANCPKDQYMVVKTASYRGLPAIKTCGLSDDYSCEADVTCLIKKQCDGQHECRVTVDDNLFSEDVCFGSTKYLYFEYQCVNTTTSFNKTCALVPDKPRNLTVTNIKSRSAEISWLDPDPGNPRIQLNITRFWIQVKKDDVLILSANTGKVYEYKLSDFTPYTMYEISVAAGNTHGFGEETNTWFLTSEEVPSGPPLNIKTTSRSASSLSFTWDPPEKDKQNGVIISYTACVSHSENGHCFQIFTTNKREWVIRHLTASIKYYVRILANTKVGHGNYSESRGFFTNGKAAEKAIAETSSTVTFSLQIPSKTFAYFYVVALKLKDGKEPTSSGSYENSEFVTYAEARKSTNSKPYIAAVVTSSGVDRKMFVLGDGRNTSDPTSRRRRSTSSGYYNGPLEPGSSYSIFQRIVLSDKVEYYSTDWSPASKTSEYAGSPSILIKTSSGDIKAQEGDLVNLLCSAQGEPPVSFSWKKDKKPLESFMEKDKPHHSSLLVVTVKDQTSFGKYTCHIRDRFESTTYTMSVLKDTCIGNPTSVPGTDKNDDGSEIYLVGIIILAILLNILVFIFICQNRRLKSKANLENKTHSRNNSNDTYHYADKDDGSFQDVKNEQPTSTALERLGEEENADHVYSQLNEVQNDHVQLEEETGM